MPEYVVFGPEGVEEVSDWFLWHLHQTDCRKVRRVKYRNARSAVFKARDVEEALEIWFDEDLKSMGYSSKQMRICYFCCKKRKMSELVWSKISRGHYRHVHKNANYDVIGQEGVRETGVWEVYRDGEKISQNPYGLLKYAKRLVEREVSKEIEG